MKVLLFKWFKTLTIDAVVQADGVGIVRGLKPLKEIPYIKFVPLVNQMKAKVRRLVYNPPQEWPHVQNTAYTSSVWEVDGFPIQARPSYDVYPHN